MLNSPMANGHTPSSPFASSINNGTFSEQAALSLTNINDINRFLNETVAKERSIDAELEQLLTKRVEVEKNIMGLHAASTEMLELIRIDAEQLLMGVTTTAELADRVSSKVRELDMAQTRVTDTMKRINMTVDRTNCINGVRDALSEGSLEQAAEFVATFLQLEEEMQDVTDSDSLQALEQRQVLTEAQQTLEGIVRQRYADAARTRDHSNLLRYLKLYKPLRMQEEGLANFVEYVQSLISEQSSASYDALMDAFAQNEQPDFYKAISSVLTMVVAAVEENEDMLLETFGQSGLQTCLQSWHAQCEKDVCKVLQRFVTYRQLPQLARDVGATHRPGATVSSKPVSLDPRTVEGYLEDLLLLCQSCEEYFQVMADRVPETDGGGVASPRSPPSQSAADALLRAGPLNALVRELLGYYITLEEYYMEESVSKAMRIDEYTSGSVTTSMVDDVFFILQKCSRRALASGRVMSVAAILSHSNILLSGTYRETLSAKLQGAAARLLQSATAAEGGRDSGTLSASPATAQYVAPFNNAEVSAGYVVRLRQQLEELTIQLFTAPAEREKVKSVLADLGKTSNDFKALGTKALDTLCGGIMPRLRHVLDGIAQVSYELSESEYAANEVADTWVQQLLASLEAALHWLQPLLTPTNHDTLFHLVLDKVVSRLESLMLAKRFNQLGGLQLDRDIRVLVSQLSDITQRTVRDKFSRLTQMATILGLESCHEMLDYWGDNNGAITWRLTEADVRQVLSQRTDFQRSEIAQLPL